MSKNVVVKIKKLDNCKELPSYQTKHSAGMDLCAGISSPVTISPLQRLLIPTGLKIELPELYEAQIRPRSGLSIKHGITVINSPGTIDSDYRGEIMIALVNLSNEPYTINPNDRIAQMIIAPVCKATIEEVDVLSDTSRSSGGFGSTGY